MKNVLMVIAPQTFRDEEYARPKEVLEGRGARVVTASAHVGTCTGKLGMTAEASVTVADADSHDYDAVVFIGGAGAATYFDDPHAHELARTALAAERVTAAICIAPSILAHAGLLEGRRVTAFESQHDDLVQYGAIWTGEQVTVDGLIITANGPDAAIHFGEAIASALGI